MLLPRFERAQDHQGSTASGRPAIAPRSVLSCSTEACDWAGWLAAIESANASMRTIVVACEANMP